MRDFGHFWVWRPDGRAVPRRVAGKDGAAGGVGSFKDGEKTKTHMRTRKAGRRSKINPVSTVHDVNQQAKITETQPCRGFGAASA